MTKNKKLVSRLMFALLVLTLVSFCFVGFTFARYTSGGEGTATVNVAKWDVTFGVQGTAVSGVTTVTVDNLSPSKADYASGSVRTNSTAAFLVATITNNSEVAAKVTLSTGTGVSVTPVASAPSDYVEANAKLPFSIKFYKDAEAKNEITVADGFELAAKTGDTAPAQDIYAVVTWTSDNLSDSITNGDANDTMIGKYVESVSWTITYTAVQDSKLPA